MTKHGSKKLRLSPIQREILWILRDAGEEGLSSTLNMLRTTFPEMPNNELRSRVEDAMKGLWMEGLIAVTKDYEKPGLRFVSVSPEEAQRILTLARTLQWDEDGGFWYVDKRELGQFRINLILTEKGRDALTK